jgi:tetratricopeptide (TPR) repeat protein
MIYTLLLLQAAVSGPTAPPVADRYERCIDLAVSDPAAAEGEASQWRLAGGGFLARQCLGLAYATRQNWQAAGEAFEGAARDAEVAKEKLAANYWAQAGNAWLVAGDPVKARAALDAALASGTLTGLALGEAHLDRARAQVAAGALDSARADLDMAVVEAAADPLAWLLSATLARRMQDMPRAQKDIRQALELSPDDAAVQLEAGNIAALASDEAAARTYWQRAVELAPGTETAIVAKSALTQFGPER